MWQSIGFAKHSQWQRWVATRGFCIFLHCFVMITAWNPKQPFINGCFNWMIPNLYLGNGCFTKHPSINGCLEFQVIIYYYDHTLHSQMLLSNMKLVSIGFDLQGASTKKTNVKRTTAPPPQPLAVEPRVEKSREKSLENWKMVRWWLADWHVMH